MKLHFQRVWGGCVYWEGVKTSVSPGAKVIFSWLWSLAPA